METLTEIAKKNNRQVGQPTAYALAIEARFSQNLTIKKPNPNEFEEKLINNTIQNFIYRDKDNPQLENQTLLVATTKDMC